MRPGHLVVLSKRSTKLRDRFFKLIRLEQRCAKAVMSRGESFILRERRAIRRYRLIEFSDSLVSETEVVVSVGIRPAPAGDRTVVSFDGFFDFAFRVVRGAKPEICLGEFLRLIERLALRADRLIELPLAEISEPEIVISLREFAVALIDRRSQRGD